ncbi:MAG: PAS domain S-box protein [bacterium]
MRPRKKRNTTVLTFSQIAIQPGDIVIVLDLKGRIVNWNDEAERVLGFTAEEVIGQPWSVLFPNSGLVIKSVVAGGEFAAGFEARRKDTARVGLYFYATAIYDENRTVTGVVCVGRDVTPFWRPHEQKEEIEKRFATLAELTTDGVLILSSRGRIIKANKVVTDLLGVANPDFLTGRNIIEFIVPEEKTNIASFRNILLRHGRNEGLVKVNDTSGMLKQIAVRAAVVEGAWEWQILVTCRDISQEIGERSAILLAEEKFRRLFEASPTPLILETVDGTIVDVNVKGGEMFQMPRQNIIGKKLRDLVPDDVKPLFPEIRATLFEKGEFRIDVVTKRPDGSRVWVESAASLIDIGGNAFILLNIRDVSRERELLEKLKENEARLELLMRRIPAIIWTTDTEFKITSVLGSALSGLGLSPEELLGTDFRNVFKEPTLGDVQHRALKGESVEFDFSYRGRSYQGRVQSLHSAEGVLIGTVGIAQDVTEIRRVEAEARERTVAYQTILETAPVGIGVHQDGKVVMVNPAGARLLGYDEPAELIGLSVFDIVHPDDRPLAMKRIRDVLEQGKVGEPVEERFRRRDGSYLPIECVNAPFVWDGRPAVLVVVRDLSVEKKLTGMEEMTAHMRAIFEYTPHGIAAQSEGRIVYANPQFASIFGYQLSELIGKPVKELIPEYDEERITAYARDRFQGKPVPSPYLIEGRRKDGSICRLKVDATTYDIDGKRYILSFVTPSVSD